MTSHMLRALARVILLCAILPGARAEKLPLVGPVPSNYFGTYTGVIVVGPEARPVFEERLARIDIGASGIEVRLLRDQQERWWGLRYTNNVILPSGPSSGGRFAIMPIIRRRDFAFGLAFSQNERGRGDRIWMATANQLIGVFKREPDGGDRHGETLELLRAEFDAHIRTHESTPIHPALLSGEAELAFRRTDAAQKIWTLERLGRLLEGATERELDAIFRIIAIAVNDANPEVKREAILSLSTPEMVTQAFAPLKVLAARASELDDNVLAVLIRAFDTLVINATHAIERRARIWRRFGTDDLDEIHRRTEGLMIPELDPPLADLIGSGVLPSRAWTAEMRSEVYQILLTLAHSAPTDFSRGRARDVLRHLARDGHFNWICQKELGG